VLRQQHAKPFNKMLKECMENEEYAAASRNQGPQRSTESMFMALIFQQQKMISKLMKQIESDKGKSKQIRMKKNWCTCGHPLESHHTGHCLGNRNEKPHGFHPTIEYLGDCSCKKFFPLSEIE
jgi:hypothetical protein